MVQISPTGSQRGRAAVVPSATPGAGPAPTRADATRRRILEAASRVFRRQGLAATGMRDIAAELGMTVGNLYYYFKNKQELLFFCQDHSLDRLIAAVQAIAALDAPEDEKLRRAIVEHVVCVLDELDGASAHTEFHVLPDDLKARLLAKRDRYESLVRALVSAGIKSGVFAAVDAKMATLALLGALNGAPRWYRPGGGRAPKAIGEHFASLFLDGLRNQNSQSHTIRRAQ